MRPPSLLVPGIPSLRRLAALLAVSLAFMTPAWATPDEPAQAEIDHLMDFVGTSHCTFIRNGTMYAAPEARAHLEMKYRFAKMRLSTADEFIKHLASGSSSSGEAYHVRCEGTELLAGDWLTAELKRFRAAPVSKR
jgi:hypothetical protein